MVDVSNILWRSLTTSVKGVSDATFWKILAEMFITSLIVVSVSAFCLQIQKRDVNKEQMMFLTAWDRVRIPSAINIFSTQKLLIRITCKLKLDFLGQSV